MRRKEHARNSRRRKRERLRREWPMSSCERSCMSLIKIALLGNDEENVKKNQIASTLPAVSTTSRGCRRRIGRAKTGRSNATIPSRGRETRHDRKFATTYLQSPYADSLSKSHEMDKQRRLANLTYAKNRTRLPSVTISGGRKNFLRRRVRTPPTLQDGPTSTYYISLEIQNRRQNVEEFREEDCSFLVDIQGKSLTGKRSKKIPADVCNMRIRYKRAATIIQTYMRTYLATRTVESSKCAIHLLQRVFRGYRERRRLWKGKQDDAIRVIRPIFREYAKYCIQRRSKVIRVQRVARVYLVRRQIARAKVFAQKAAATERIQRLSRRWLVRRERARSIIGQCVSRWSNRRRVLRSSLHIQRVWRGTQTRRLTREMRKMRSRLVLIQSLVRGTIQRRRHRECRSAVTHIQRVYLEVMEKRTWVKSRNAARHIQKWFRKVQARLKGRARIGHKMPLAAGVAPVPGTPSYWLWLGQQSGTKRSRFDGYDF